MKPQYFFALLPLALYACGNPSGSVAISADKAIEAKVEKTLSGMSLDDKIGQIIELEINLVTYNDPSLSLQSIAVMSEEQKDALIHEYGLQDQFKASELNIDFTAEAPDMNQGMKLYALYNAIAAKYPFKVDEVALDSLITKYRVGSLLNTPKGTAQPPQVWNYQVHAGAGHSQRVRPGPDARDHLYRGRYAVPVGHQHSGYVQSRPGLQDGRNHCL